MQDQATPTASQDQQKLAQADAIASADALLRNAGLPTFSQLALGASDVAEGIEDMKNLPGAVPKRLEKLKNVLHQVSNAYRS